jgi:AraC-like DNA-binding protein
MPDSIVISQSIIEPLPAYVAAVSGATKAYVDLKRDVGRVSKPYGEPEVSANRVMQLFDQLARDLNNPAFGLEYARAFPVGGTGAFGFIVTQAQDMRTAVMAIARYTQIVMPSVDVRYEPVEGGAQLTWSYPLVIGAPLVQFNSFAAALVVLRMRSWLSDTWCPKRVQFAHRDPGAGAKYRRMFGANLSFEQPVNRFTFIEANLNRPNVSADPRLYKVVKQLADILLAERKTVKDFRASVANKIVDLMGVANPTLALVAKELKLGERTVQRRLALEGWSFEDVLGASRRSVAERLLRDTELPLTDIAFMLGFSELSAFTRAAKRWHGVSPRQFRAMRRG